MFIESERGASSVEYSLLAAAVAALIVLLVFAIGDLTGTLFRASCEQLSDKISSSTSCA